MTLFSGKPISIVITLLVVLASLLLGAWTTRITPTTAFTQIVSHIRASLHRSSGTSTGILDLQQTLEMATTTLDHDAFSRKALDDLPATPNNIPAFFFAHGSPILAFPASSAASLGEFAAYQGPTGPLARFLVHFGPTLLNKYDPKAIVVFSAHWETAKERLGTSSLLLKLAIFG